MGVILLEVLLLKSSLALQLLCTVALQMAKLLERRRIPHARDQLSWLCSRDPTDLGIEDLVGGTLESDPRHNLGPPTPPPQALSAALYLRPPGPRFSACFVLCQVPRREPV